MSYDDWKLHNPYDDEPEPPAWWHDYYNACEEYGVAARDITYDDISGARNHLQEVIDGLQDALDSI